MMCSFNLSYVDEEIKNNETKCIQALSTTFKKKKPSKNNLAHNFAPCSKGEEINKMRMWI